MKFIVDDSIIMITELNMSEDQTGNTSAQNKNIMSGIVSDNLFVDPPTVSGELEFINVYL